MLVRHFKNRGQCPARNSGVSKASADWVAFLDSDDELMPDALSTVVDGIRAAPPNIARLAFCYVCDDGRVSPSPGFGRELVDYETYLRWTNSVVLSDFFQCVRRSTFDQVRFPDTRAKELGYHHDFAITFQTRFLPESVARLHADAPNRSSSLMTAERPEATSQRAADQGADITQTLIVHGDAIQRYAPGKLQVYRRLRAQYALMAGARMTGLRLALQNAAAYPVSIHSWGVLGLGVLGSGALRWCAKAKARAALRLQHQRT